ncbi:cyanophycin synthetase [Leptolyngbya sp. FACHB-36]|uniref:ATP-binding protein n=1 Tax=Leptolyngbya sp. FACHB-36 TaxID=2692808 RepID=UPI0016813280|nr:cyanophycin synthetase [Leptolyngbya sp. FACHB-36]
MISEPATDLIRVNARRTDAFDLFNFGEYIGPNPYLNTGAFVFDFALTQFSDPLPLDNYVQAISHRYPHFLNDTFESYAQLFARTVSETGRLDMDLHLDRWSLTPREKCVRIAIESLHTRTSRAVAYSVWDWFEAITQGKSFRLDNQLEMLQDLFRRSIYGGPTIYALLRTAHDRSIPAFYLWDEGLMQYGYGKKQVRGVATTFDTDSHLDSDFTTRKDDCKAFLGSLGFPVPKGSVVVSLDEALSEARRIGYPVAIKPVDGHKGIGVTADVQDAEELERAYDRSVAAIPENQSVRIIVESSLSGKDYRLLCVNGRFVAATERQPASIVGDGESTVQELIDRENQSPARTDTPTSPLGKIKTDESMMLYLEEQRLSLESVIEQGRKVFLRKVANLSAGGLSIDATPQVHPDTIILAQDVAQQFRLTCLGIDVIAQDISKSWRESSFGIIEINAAPGIFMHLKPTVGETVDVTSRILETFFESSASARIPIVTFNRVSVEDLLELIDRLLEHHPEWTIGAVCREGVFVNRSEKNLSRDYNANVLNLLRNRKLDLLIAEYSEDVLEKEGMFYYGSNLVVLDEPSETEKVLTRDALDRSTVVIKHNNTVTIQREGLMEQYSLGPNEAFQRVYLKELATLL